MAARWATSPVGPYVALGVAVPARRGTRVGVCFTTVVVSTTDARAAGRALWGLPCEYGSLGWVVDADTAEIRWEDRGVALRATFGRRAVELVLPVPALQTRLDDPVVVPTRLRARARRGRVEIEVPPGDRLAALAGRRRGAHLGGVELVLRPAAVPRRLRAALRAPARGVEPGLP
jgi:acetoacetate decarboxylase